LRHASYTARGTLNGELEMIMDYWTTFKAWYARPFDQGMTATQWFIFAGLLIVIMILWRLILSHIAEIAE
jgi:hypothetical protein